MEGAALSQFMPPERELAVLAIITLPLAVQEVEAPALPDNQGGREQAVF